MKGKILIMTSTFPRWQNDNVAPFVFEIATGLVESGWEVSVLAPHDAGAKKEEYLDGVYVRRFSYSWPASSQTLCYRGGAVVSLRESRTQWIKLPLFLIAQFVSVMMGVLRSRPNIIHAHWVLPQGAVAALVGKMFRIPVVVTVHGGDVFGLRQSVFRYIKKLAFSWADSVTANSSASERAVLSLVSRRIDRIPIGTKFQPVDEESLLATRKSPNKYQIIFIGRLIEEKGILDLLDAIPMLIPRIPNVECVIVGDGPLREVVEERIKQLGLKDKVRLVGWLSSGAVRETLRQGDVFVGPSCTSADGWVEAQGVVFAEALLSGIPVVATRSGGIPDTIRDGETGILVAERSPNELAQAINKIYSDPEFARFIARNGWEHAKANYSMLRTIERFSALFEKIAK